MSQSGVYIHSSGSGGIVETLTGNTGGAVGPTGGNINVVGSGSISVTGIPGSSTLTISSSLAATTYDGNTGTATPSANVLNVTGSGVISVSASGNTLAITSTSSAALTYKAVSTTPYVVLTTDTYLGVNSSAGAITIELPNAPATSFNVIIKDSTGSAATNNITVTTVGGTDLIDGATSFVMNTNYESVNVTFNGTGYEVF